MKNMREAVEGRLEQLKAELDKGHKLAAELDQQRATLQQQLLRIAGAARVLEELLEAEAGDAGPS